ncbi:hypothetical protein GGR50DRAFT_42900 [Xylaria sp. CBS 124048]|nr:hypothetical protein GGR50DRAFT_42900 [Xylaria sp. CBS 124048]
MSSTEPYTDSVPIASSKAFPAMPTTLPPPPPHVEYTDDEGTELTPSTLSASSTAVAPATTITTVPSPSDTAFTCTRELQIQTPGKALISIALLPRKSPIPIFAIGPDGRPDQPLYLSIRPTRRSGSCFLVRGDDASRTPLTSTTHPFGPGRPAVVHLGGPATANAEGKEGRYGIKIMGSLVSRAVGFQIPSLGSFRWRYGNAEERAEVGARSVMICEYFVPSNQQQSDSHSGEKNNNGSTGDNSNNGHGTNVKTSLIGRPGSGVGPEKQKDSRGSPRRVAQFIRNKTFRTPGTTALSSGNGGRLMLDLRVFDDKDREHVEWLIVTTAIAMLKREVDRLRAEHVIFLAALAG